MRILSKESLLVVLSSISAYQIFHHVLLTNCCCEHKLTISSILATSSITAFGFALTSMAILTAIIDKPAIQNVAKLNKLHTLINRTTRAAIGFLVLFTLSLLLIVIEDIYYLALTYASITFFLVWSLLMFLRIGRWYLLILKTL